MMVTAVRITCVGDLAMQCSIANQNSLTNAWLSAVTNYPEKFFSSSYRPLVTIMTGLCFS